MEQPLITYTMTDEAPALATYSFLPMLRAVTRPAGIKIDLRDISLAGRILAAFPDFLQEGQRVRDDLAYLGELTQRPEANIIKLPNISASVPQLRAAIAELQSRGYRLPDYPEAPSNEQEREIRSRFDRIKGSAVNPVLREGNSDRRAPKAVKDYARKHPHAMGAWSADSRTRVASMSRGDFFANEQSFIAPEPMTVAIEWVDPQGQPRILKESIALQAGEIFDATFLSKKELLAFYSAALDEARRNGVLFSLHLKATMMKVSDPVIFGHAVRVMFRPLIEQHGQLLERLQVDFNNGLSDLVTKMETLPVEERQALEKAVQDVLASGPDLAMVNSDRGITNLHVPSDVIVDASMPAMIREGGKMWDKDGKARDTLAVIPDRSYAGVYQAVIDFCKEHGALDPRTIGSVSNVGLMAQKAEEYGSHDKTFIVPGSGVIRVIDASGKEWTRHQVEAGDIWRACQTKDAAVRDWVKLAISRARISQTPAVFWLDSARAHDARLMEKVLAYLKEHDTEGLDLRILPPAEACRFSLERMVRGQDTISVTGNVLRDYLTDLFPILELGTSAKMLSVVPLMNGGGLFETGAGGSAPKHVQQFLQENYLRWDSLGEFLALVASLEHLSRVASHAPAAVLASALDRAIGRFLEENKSPARKVGEIDNRGSHFFLILFWAEEIAQQRSDQRLSIIFRPLAHDLKAAASQIEAELLAVQGRPVNIGGYYFPEEVLVNQAMRPSPTLNNLINHFHL